MRTEAQKESKRRYNKTAKGRIVCVKMMAKWRHSEKGKATNRRLRLKYAFGITIEQYNEMHRAQNDLCAICGESSSIRPLCVDHNHDTEQIRGLLCRKCNVALGFFKVDNLNVELLCSAISYLRQYD